MVEWRDHILREKHHFAAAWSSGHRLKTPCCVFYWCDADHTYPRFAVVASKKVSKSAVYRNQIKRWHRTLFQQHRAMLLPKDIVVVARHTATPLQYHDLLESWRALCHHFNVH